MCAMRKSGRFVIRLFLGSFCLLYYFISFPLFIHDGLNKYLVDRCHDFNDDDEDKFLHTEPLKSINLIHSSDPVPLSDRTICTRTLNRFNTSPLYVIHNLCKNACVHVFALFVFHQAWRNRRDANRSD